MKSAFFSKQVIFISTVLLFLIAGWLIYDLYFSPKKIKNVILISMDTTRWDALSCYEGPVTKTPVIDAVAAEGILFERTISPLPYTLPAHSSMLTGKIPPDHKVLDNTYYSLEDEQLTLAETLKNRGFKTAAFVSSFILDSQFGLDQGFDHYDDDLGEKKTAGQEGINERRGDKTTDRAIQWLQKHQDEKNFLFVHYYDPHFEYVPPEPFATKYQQLLPDLPKDLQAYAGEVGFVDHCIGQLIKKLKELDLYENTLICITADHGDSHGEHKEYTHGFFAYNATTQVPLIFKIPNVNGPVRIKEHVGIVDIVPTIYSLLEIPYNEIIQGRDLGPYWREQKDPYPDRSIFFQANEAMKYDGNSLLGVISGDYKYIQTTRPELYNLANDPQELFDIIADQPHRARIMQDSLRQLLDNVAANEADGKVELDVETITRLQSLGYLGTMKDMKGAFDFDQTKEDPKDLIDYHLMTNEIHLLISSKQYDKAKNICEKYINMRPDFHMGYSAMAKILKDLGEYPESITFLNKIIKLNPDNETAYLDLISICEKMNDFDEVRKYALKLLEINSNNLAAFFHLAVSHFEKGSYELPETYLTDSMKSSDFYSKMIITLADKLVEKRQITRAFELYREGLELEKNSEYVLNTLGWMSATSAIKGVQNPRLALDYSLQLCELDGYQKAEYLDTLAAAYAANDNFQKAVTTAQKAAALASQDGNKALAQRIQRRMQLYKTGKMFIDDSLK